MISSYTLVEKTKSKLKCHHQKFPSTLFQEGGGPWSSPQVTRGLGLLFSQKEGDGSLSIHRHFQLTTMKENEVYCLHDRARDCQQAEPPPVLLCTHKKQMSAVQEQDYRKRPVSAARTACWSTSVCASLTPRPMTVVFGLGTRQGVHMHTRLENGVVRNRQ